MRRRILQALGLAGLVLVASAWTTGEVADGAVGPLTVVQDIWANLPCDSWLKVGDSCDSPCGGSGECFSFMECNDTNGINECQANFWKECSEEFS